MPAPGEDGHLQAQERGLEKILTVLGRNQPCAHLDLGLWPPDLGDNKCILFKPSPPPPICGTLLQRPESAGHGGRADNLQQRRKQEWGQMKPGRRKGAQSSTLKSLGLIFGQWGGMGVFKLGRKVVSLENHPGGFPGSPVASTLHLHSRGHSFDPGQGNKSPHATCCSQKIKERTSPSGRRVEEAVLAMWVRDGVCRQGVQKGAAPEFRHPCQQDSTGASRG